MAKFQITGPDGGTYEVEAPDNASEQQVLEYVRANAGQQQASLNPAPNPGRFAAPQGMEMPQQQPKTWGETAADVAKSSGIGLAQGVIGIASMPGNIEALGRMGIDKAGQMMGYDPQTTKGQVLPHYGDYKGAFEQFTGKFYEPKTVPGEYARTVGEFAPMAAGGGGPLAAAARVAVPAGLSETAGQMTKGTEAEPWARAGGALAGSLIPRTAGRAVSPAQPDPERARQVAILEREGIQPTAGQRTGSESLMYRETNATSAPMSGRGPTALQERPLEQFTQAMMRRAGSNAPRATAEAIDDTFVNLGQRFDQLGQNAHLAVRQPRLQADLNQVLTRYEDLKPGAMTDGHPRAIVDGIINGRTVRAGESYAAIRHDLTQQANALRHNDPALSRAYAGIRDALDAAVERGLPANMRGQFQEVRGQYRNLLAIVQASTGAGSETALGLITPQRMRQALVGQDKRSYARGQREMDEVTRAGNAVIKQLPNSGTPARLQAMGVNAALWGGLGAAATGNPMGVAAAAMGPVGQGAYARAITSGPVQRYLGHQTNRPPLAEQGAGTAAPMGPILDDNDPRSRLRRAMGGQ